MQIFENLFFESFQPVRIRYLSEMPLAASSICRHHVPTSGENKIRLLDKHTHIFETALLQDDFISFWVLLRITGNALLNFRQISFEGSS